MISIYLVYHSVFLHGKAINLRTHREKLVKFYSSARET